MKNVSIGPITVGNDSPLTVIAGPCQLESLDHALMIARRMADACAAAGAAYVFKASYDKANRTSLSGPTRRRNGRRARYPRRGPCAHRLPGADRCAPRPTTARPRPRPATSSRSPPSCAARPIFCWPLAKPAQRSTSRRASSSRPGTMANVAAKVASTGNDRILLTERGGQFRLQHARYRHARPSRDDEDRLPRRHGRHPFGAAKPGGQGGSSGGQREFAPVMAARRSLAGDRRGLHPKPTRRRTPRPSDGPNMIPLDQMPSPHRKPHGLRRAGEGQPDPRLSARPPFETGQSGLGLPQGSPRATARRHASSSHPAFVLRVSRHTGPRRNPGNGQPGGTIAVGVRCKPGRRDRGPPSAKSSASSTDTRMSPFPWPTGS